MARSKNKPSSNNPALARAQPSKAQAKSNPQPQNQTSFKKESTFHNPYNFVPSLPRPIKDSKLGDFKPVGHHQYLDDYWSGRITCSLTTFTPLLIPDAANLENDKNDHKTYPVRIVDGKPYLAPTSVKGMLRSAFETVTNSRFGIFEEHGDRLAYRMEASNLDIVPVRVEREGEELVLRLMEDEELMGYAGRLPSYPRGVKNRDRYSFKKPLTYEGSQSKPQHGDKVWVRLNNENNRLDKSIITRIRKRTDDKKPGSGEWRRGWVCITGENINGKKFERVFLEGDDDQYLTATPSIRQKWRELILNYKATHVKDLKQRDKNNQGYGDYLGHEPGKTGWSRHIYEDGSEILTEGTLCYADFDDKGEVKALLPVILSRRLYQTAPWSLLDPSLHPATELGQLSAGDRVFGWVNQQGTGAYRGQLRINQVQYQKCHAGEAIEEFPEGLPLGILGEPRPQQARFYLAKNKQGQPLNPKSPQDDGYQDEQHLRGRKVYPHHPATVGRGDWKHPTKDRTQKEDARQEYRRPKNKGIEQKDDQNRSILGWVKEGTIFEFTLDVVNLSSVELGALLWLLNLGEYQKERNLFHRLGGGKPFGFGSVQIKITDTDLHRGDGWREFYGSLLPTELPQQDLNVCVEAFKDAVKSVYPKPKFEDVSFIAAFLKCVRGFDDKPIHYPRTTKRPHPEGKNFEWFVQNEGKRGFKLSLPEIVSDDGLPYRPEKPR
jgi:CRISPR-associated protein (TIGR03986 family)